VLRARGGERCTNEARDGVRGAARWRPDHQFDRPRGIIFRTGRMHRQRKNGNGSNGKTGTTRLHLLWPFFVFASYCLPSAIISGVPITSLSAVKSYIRSWKDSDVPLAASVA